MLNSCAWSRSLGAVTAGELEQDVLRFIAERYADRHLDIEVAQLMLALRSHERKGRPALGWGIAGHTPRGGG